MAFDLLILLTDHSLDVSMNSKTYFALIIIIAGITAGIFWLGATSGNGENVIKVPIYIIVGGVILSFIAVILAALADFKLYEMDKQ